MRYQPGVVRVLRELGPDRVRLGADQGETLAPNEIASLDVLEESLGLLDDGVPANRIGLLLAHLVERCPIACDTLSRTPMTLIVASTIGVFCRRRCALSAARCSFESGATSSICDRIVRNCSMTASGVSLLESADGVPGVLETGTVLLIANLLS